MTAMPANARNPVDAKLDGLLIDWYDFHRRYTLNVGHSSTSATTKDHRSAGYMDWRNGAEDDRADVLVLKAVDNAMHRIPNEHPRRYRTALEFNARNLYYRLSVWYSAALPGTREERDVLVLEARNMLLLELRREGVMG